MATTTRPPAKSTKTKLRLDLGCGQTTKEGFTGVDLWDGADVVCDLFQEPWPWKTSTVDEIYTSHLVEHTPMYRPDGKDGLICFMDECWRVLRKNGTMRVIHPFFKCERAFQDPTHRRFITPNTWRYFGRAWREEQSLDHYPITADFEVTGLGWVWYDGDVPKRSEEYQQRVTLRDWDVIADLVVDLKALK